MNSAARATQAPEQHLGPVGVDAPDERDEHGVPPAERAQATGPLEVRRNGTLSGGVGVLAAAVAIAWLGRATAGNALVDWTVVAVMAVVAACYLRAALDARTPLLIADAHGVRVRLGRAWRGLPWGAVAEVEHQPRRGLLRDGRLAIVPRDPDRFVADLDRAGRRQARVAGRLYGAPLGVPLGPSTRLVGADDDLVAQLEALADPSVRVVDLPARSADTGADTDGATDIDTDGDADTHAGGADAGPGLAAGERSPAADQDLDRDLDRDLDPDADADGDAPAPIVRDPRPWFARVIAGLSGRRIRAGQVEAGAPAEEEEEEERVAEEEADRALPVDRDRPEALEALADEVRLVVPDADPDPAPGADDATWDATEGASADDAAEDDAAEDDAAEDEGRAPGPRWADRVRPIARPGQPVEPLVIDDFQVEPATDPVVGPDVAAARTRLGLTVDQLAERTRIRPHVIESIEVDDFAPCGGDFYARGHLRTLARVLGIDVVPLLHRYDERYAHEPVDARRVFEAELASAGARTRPSRLRGGPNWSVLVAAFMAVVLCWSVAQLVLDTPPDVRPPTPTLRDGSGGVANGAVSDAEPVPVLVGAVQGGATIEVRDGNGETVFSGDVAYGESRALDVVPPVRVRSDDGGAVEVTVDGEWRGRMGRLGETATQTYAAGG